MSVESSNRIEKFTYEIHVSGHKLVTDVPIKFGGLNKGPDPHDYLQVALAGCTIITMQMYADRKGIPLKSADVKISIVKEGLENQILREIKLIGDLTEDQSQRLLEIADKCPIHNFLKRGSKIESRLV